MFFLLEQETSFRVFLSRNTVFYSLLASLYLSLSGEFFAIASEGSPSE